MAAQFWITLIIAFGVSSAPANPEIYRRIIDGDRSERFEFPWLTTIQSYKSHICGGVLLNQDTMVTAAHCSNQTISPFLRVSAHRHNLFAPRFMERGLKFSVESIAVHPEFDPVNVRNDVAVWKLKLIRGDKDRIPVDLVELDDGSISNDPAITKFKIAGWGVTRVNAVFTSARQREGEVIEVPDQECKNTYPDLDSSGICAKSASEDSGTTCFGDSGGPLFVERGDGKVTVVGLSSYTKLCGKDGGPNVYAKISAMLDWIKSQI